MVATYVSAQTPLTFSADATADAKYTLEAVSAGTAKLIGRFVSGTMVRTNLGI